MRLAQNRQRAPHELGMQRFGDVEVDVRILRPPHEVGEPTEFGEPRDAPCVCRDGRKRVGGQGTDRAVAAGSCEELISKQWYERSRHLRTPEKRSLIPVEQRPEQSGVPS